MQGYREPLIALYSQWRVPEFFHLVHPAMGNIEMVVVVVVAFSSLPEVVRPFIPRLLFLFTFL